jgi:Copper amine oxidase, enzyme domain
MKENEVEHNNLQINIEKFGPGPEAIDEVSQATFNHPSVREQLSETRHRLLSVQLLKSAGQGKPDEPIPPDRYQATIYDYTNNRVVLATGNLDDIRGSMELSEAGHQPLPNREEFDEAVEILLEDEDLGPAIREQRLVPYPPMPPLIEAELPDGRLERTLAVGLLPREREARHEIVGANMIHRTVARFHDRAPERAVAAAATCGLPNADQDPTRRGIAGQFQVTISQPDRSPLWSFLVIRPSASSGTNASGVELQNVRYRGKLVLFQAHAPILNVQYDRDACGPFRDWLFQESWIRADGTNVAPGIRRSQTPAQTILESGSDSGNFRGVAIYRQAQETVVVSELQAGWYRYVSRWRFHDDGTIRPRFGFSAVEDSCVCNVHHHHVYWRFDFDIGTRENNVVREFNSPPIFPPDNWHTHRFEATRRRRPDLSRRWQIRNTQTGDAYNLIPGPDDGVADIFGRGDVWILRFNEGQIDDGISAAPSQRGESQANAPAQIGRFVNGESVAGQDVVVWYAAHFTHDVHEDEENGHAGHIVGPVLRPING